MVHLPWSGKFPPFDLVVAEQLAEIFNMVFLARLNSNWNGFAVRKFILIGMNFACKLSAQITGFKQTAQVVELLNQYGLPTNVAYNKTKVLNALLMDKKKALDKINFIVLQKIGKATIELIKLTNLEKLLEN